MAKRKNKENKQKNRSSASTLFGFKTSSGNRKARGKYLKKKGEMM
jgi:hypothetical protein